MAAPSPVRLADLIRDGRTVTGLCIDCFRERDIPAAYLPLPGDTPVPEIGKRMRCTSCGGRRINTRPELYPGGILAYRERSR